MNKISVIVPFYNGKKTLDRCFKSILAQTYENFEVIAVNDGSTDSSLDIVRSYAEKDKRIKVITKEHAGVSAARNCALDNATGDLIQFIDADDDVEPDMFETMLRLMESTGADVVVCNHDHPCISNYIGDTVMDFSDKRNIWRFYQNTFAAVVPWNKLFKRNIITEKFDEEVSFNEDDLFCLSNIANARKVASTSKVLYHYFVAPPETSLEESSCINKMAKAEDFWQTRNTFWYMRDKLMPKVKNIVKRRIPRELSDEFTYTRTFDFMTWELVILISLGADRYGLVREMQNIFSEKNFIKSLEIREKYGVFFKNFSETERDMLVERFVDMSIFTINDISERKLNLKPYYVVLDLFAKMFISAEEDLNELDFVAKAATDMKTISSAEAKYAEKLIDKFSEEKSGMPEISFNPSPIFA